jgi:lipopolysaccharide heptosyltransferase I
VRILIVKTSSMGDVVHALPLAADIAAEQPGAQIDWLVEEAFAAIPAMSRHISQVHRVALRRWRTRPFQIATWREMAAVRRALVAQSYDLVLDAQGLLKSAWLSRWAHAPVAGPSSDSARERVASLLYNQRLDVPRELHAVVRCRQLGATALGYVIDTAPRFDLASSAAPAVRVQGAYAVLLANASRPSKLWPDAHWIALEAWLAERGLESLLFWGTAAEESRARQLVASMHKAQVVPRSTIATIAATLAGSSLVVGLDTGLTHLAAALGRPAVGIFCDYDPNLVGLTGNGPVESLGGVDRLPAATDVIAAAARVLKAHSDL